MFDGCDQASIGVVDSWSVADDLGDAHVGYVFGANDAVEACGFHLAAAEAEEGYVGMAGAEFGDELRAVVVAAGFAGGEEDARIGWVCDAPSVNWLDGRDWTKAFSRSAGAAGRRTGVDDRATSV